MALIAGLLGVLGCLMLLVAMLGGIAPSIFKDKKTGVIPKRTELLGGGILGALITFAISAWLSPATETGNKADMKEPSVTATAKVSSEAHEAPSAEPVKSLGMRPEDFRREFNRIVGQVNQDYKLAEFDIEKGDVNDSFKRSAAPNVGLVGMVNKSDGTIKEMVFIVGGGKQEDVLKPVIVLLTASQASNPKEPKEEISKAVMAMLKQALKQMDKGESVERTIGKVRYTAAASNATGLMFSISPT